MRTRKFKTTRGWLEFISNHHGTPRERVYEPLNEFFADEMQVRYFTGSGADIECRRDCVSVPWEQKMPIAQRIVDFHWRSRNKGERQRIAESLAQGRGDLSMLRSFIVELRKNGGEWRYDFCTSGLSGPNYDWCRRMYLRSL